jgi:voltage-gated potassium channel Kch
VLDHDPTQIEALRRFGHRVFYGNAASPDLLRAAGAEQAKLIIIAVDDPEVALATVDAANKHYPHLSLLARAHDRMHAYELMKRGVGVVQRETFDSGLALGVEALKHLGLHAYQAKRLGQIFKRHDEKALRDMYEIYGDENAFILESRRQAQELESLLKSEHAAPDIEPDSAWDVTELGKNIRQGRF